MGAVLLEEDEGGLDQAGISGGFVEGAGLPEGMGEIFIGAVGMHFPKGCDGALIGAAELVFGNLGIIGFGKGHGGDDGRHGGWSCV